jgi:acetyl esterase
MTATPFRTSPGLPGRLGDEARSPASDERYSPAMLAGLAAVGLDVTGAPPPVSSSDDLETVLAAVRAAHDGFQALYETIELSLPGDRDDVDVSTASITGVDGNEITLHIFRPRGVAGPLPGVVYTHGGGMAILTTDNPVHRRWCTDLALAGAVVVMVDFRNACTAATHDPFPAGVEDCLAGAVWVHEHRGELGLSSVVTQGESGGGNLAIATALLAKRRGIDAIDGVYASVPYISGGYGWDRERRLAELPSLIENDGYFYATEEDLRGLPPFVISVNELDPLRDEGIAFARKLARAGVAVSARVNLGIVHGAEVIFRHYIGASSEAAVTDVVGFAKRARGN